MKDNIKAVIGITLIIIPFIALVAAAIWAIVFNLMNPDMTELRLFIENPYPTIIAFASAAIFLIGKLLLGWVD